MYNGIKGLDPSDAIDRNIGQIARLSRLVPERVQLGFHFCFGTFGGWPRFGPIYQQRAVDLANAAVVQAGRKIDWVHIPTLDTVADSFYAPLRRWKPDGARIYLWPDPQHEHVPQRLAAARRHLPDFGLAAYCGFGREPVSALPQILEDLSVRGSDRARNASSGRGISVRLSIYRRTGFAIGIRRICFIRTVGHVHRPGRPNLLSRSPRSHRDEAPARTPPR